MELNDEQFWQALRQALELAEAEEAEEMAAAERLLAETPVDVGAQLSEEHIAEAVRFATATSTAEQEAEEQHEGREQNHDADRHVAPLAMAAVPAPRLSWRRRLVAALPRPLAAAAAILLAPQFLAAATVVTVVVVTAVVLRNTTHTLSFLDAVTLMMQDEQPEQARVSSQSVVFSHVLESIQIVQSAASESTAVAAPAARALDDLRLVLAQGGTFVPRQFTDPHLYLGDLLADTKLDTDERARALQQLSEQMAYGLTAMKAIEQGSSPANLKLQNRALLRTLSDALAQ